MAKGYPDFFGQSIWPKYGTMIVDSDSVDTAGAAETDVLTLTGAGVWTYLLGILTPLAAGGEYTIRLYVDGGLLFILTSGSAYVCAYNEGGGSMLRVNYSDKSNDLIHVMLSKDLPFHDSIRVTVQRSAAINVNFTYYLGWYKVT